MAEEKKKKDRSKWFREMRSELKKVVWPTASTTAKNTGTVLLCSLVVGACIWIFDYVAVSAVHPAVLAFETGLIAMIEGRTLPVGSGAELQLLQISREIIKRSPRFRLCLPPDIENFTPLPFGSLLAEDVIIYEPDGRYQFYERDGATRKSGANFGCALIAFPSLKVGASPRIPFVRGIGSKRAA